MHAFWTRNPKRRYTMANQMLEESSEERDLGVIIDESLKFHRHAAAAVKKYCFGKKRFITLDTRTLSLLYKSMMMLHLEYGNVIWGSHYKGYQVMVEKVQKRETANSMYTASPI